MERARSAVWSAEFTDADAMAAAQRDANVEYLSLAPHRYAARLTVVDLGSVRLQDAVDQAHIARGQTERGRYVLLYGRGPMGPGTIVNGYAMTEGDALLLAPNSELYAVTRGRLDWSAVVLEAAAFDEVADSRGWPRAQGYSLRPGFLENAPGLTAMTAVLPQVARDNPDRLGLGSVPDAVIESLAAAVAQGFRDRPADERGGRSVRRFVRLVASAVDMMDAAIGRAVYTRDLCAALGVAPRTLHDAFIAVYGMSVHRYLRIRRLNLARSALLTCDGAQGLVKSVALDLGFWHLGRFAQQYRALFGESPSDTLINTRRPAPTRRATA